MFCIHNLIFKRTKYKFCTSKWWSNLNMNKLTIIYLKLSCMLSLSASETVFKITSLYNEWGRSGSEPTNFPLFHNINWVIYKKGQYILFTFYMKTTYAWGYLLSFIHNGSNISSLCYDPHSNFPYHFYIAKLLFSKKIDEKE